MGAITRTVLEGALQRQREEGGRLGEILVAQGSVTPEVLGDGLARRLERAPRPPLRAASTPRS